jgi:cytochrome d ubiquinol oxidase subunit I
MQATEVAQQQPAKLAAMEAQYNDGPAGMSLIGIPGDSAATTSTISIPGFVSWLVTGSATTTWPGITTLDQQHPNLSADKYPGLSDTARQYKGSTVDANGNLEQGVPNVGITFATYHIMIILWAVMILWLIFAGVVLHTTKDEEPGSDKSKIKSKALKYLIIYGPLIPFVAIQAGWMVTEIGRQPWVVYNLLLTNDAISPSVSNIEIIITILLFLVFYVILFIAWLRIVMRYIKKGPEACLDKEGVDAIASKDGADVAQAAAQVASDKKAGE